ncbi:hypothetical protein [Paractinoplanes maris]|uniref:hypothetical protein n=1 Tax=Paractinoplanes maris TaxID=1734446 RepID=UPI002020C603|nr:hypothetical protein [Actinoplanes maris]
MTGLRLSRATQEAAHAAMAGDTVFCCPACHGVAVRRIGPLCHGTTTVPHEPARMRTADSGDGDHGDTEGLVLS